MTHDDKRNGTTDLFAAMNVATGEVLTHCEKGHTAKDVLRFFNSVSMGNSLTKNPFRVDVPPAAVEIVTPSVTSSNFDETFGSPTRTTPVGLEATLRAQHPVTKYVALDGNGWVLPDVTADRVQAEWLFLETAAEPSAGTRLDATWQVVRGANRLPEGAPQTAARSDRPAAAPAPLAWPERRPHCLLPVCSRAGGAEPSTNPPDLHGPSAPPPGVAARLSVPCYGVRREDGDAP